MRPYGVSLGSTITTPPSSVAFAGLPDAEHSSGRVLRETMRLASITFIGSTRTVPPASWIAAAVASTSSEAM